MRGTIERLHFQKEPVENINEKVPINNIIDVVWGGPYLTGISEVNQPFQGKPVPV